MTSCHFCCILLIRSASVGQAHTRYLLRPMSSHGASSDLAVLQTSLCLTPSHLVPTLPLGIDHVPLRAPYRIHTGLGGSFHSLRDLCYPPIQLPVPRDGHKFCALLLFLRPRLGQNHAFRCARTSGRTALSPLSTVTQV